MIGDGRTAGVGLWEGVKIGVVAEGNSDVIECAWGGYKWGCHGKIMGERSGCCSL